MTWFADVETGASVLLHLKLCADCGREILPVLGRPASDETRFLKGIAAKMQRCDACAGEGVRLQQYLLVQTRGGWSFHGTPWAR